MRVPDPMPGFSVVAGRPRAAGCIFAEEEARLLLAAAASPAALAELLERRAAGEPLEHLLGWAEFCGLRLSVGPGVFVPRHRTRFLVRTAARLARPGAVVLDLCCGSGAVGAALAAAVGGRADAGDLFGPLPPALRGRVDILVANAPYVPTNEIGMMPREARLHEPLASLDRGPDGLDVQRRVAAAAGPWLSRSGGC